ncbi:hypothetical protein [Chamaesiphon sp. OTE_75_metabat_556]|nr:hypothetical protein [Chamaesiphon sp. OTE_75_metabat_556]
MGRSAIKQYNPDCSNLARSIELPIDFPDTDGANFLRVSWWGDG